MKIIEKKCPNCGADLKFNIGDRETKCNYCKTEFIIEDNNTDNKNFNLDNINLNQKFVRVFGITHIIATSMIILITFFIFIMALTGIKKIKLKNNQIDININDVNKNVINELYSASKEEVNKWMGYSFDYKLKGNHEEVGYYYLKNSVSIKIICVLKSTYESKYDEKTVYNAITFTGNNLDSISHTPYIKLANKGDIYGYPTLKELYNSAIKENKTFNFRIVPSNKTLYSE